MSMRQHPVVHLGFPKCASTFLQRQIFPNLRSYEYLQMYAETQEIIRKFPHELIDSSPLARLQGKRALISRERILAPAVSPRILPEQAVNAAIWNIHAALGRDVTLLVVIRRQDDIVRSRFRHKYKALLSPDNYFVDFPGRRRRSNVWDFQSTNGVYLTGYDYFSRLIPLAELFGRERVKILLYEDLVENQPRFFSALSDALDEDVSALADRAVARENVSEKRAPVQSLILQRLNNRMRGRLDRILPKREIDISNTFAEELMSIFKDGNRRLSDYFGLSLARYGYF
jgi:hypothetical protein